MSIANLRTEYLTIAEVAAALRLSRMTVYRMVRAGTLAADRFGKSYRVPESAVEEYIRRAGGPARGADAHPDPEPDTDLVTDQGSGPDPGLEPHPDPGLEPRPDPGLEPRPDPGLEPGPNPGQG